MKDAASPKFSVIVPTYNRLNLLKATLASIFSQTITDYELVIVDDGSTDGTIDYLQKLDKEATILRQPNAGPAAARNFGAEHARGAYLAFLDSDDLWFPWTLELYEQVIRSHRSPAFIAGKPFQFEDERELAGCFQAVGMNEYFDDYFSSGDEWRWWGVSSFVVARSDFMKVDGFTTQLVNGEDADLAMRLGVSPGFVQVTDPVTFAYRKHSNSAVGNIGLTIAGAWVQIQAENAGRYPGGPPRVSERLQILTRHIRPVSLRCLHVGRYADGWRLYWATFWWNLSLRRLKYLIAFPVVTLIEKLRSKRCL